MTMNINIDENFPYAGQDNDSQVFRDNFKNIKDNLTSAKTDIDALLLHSIRDDKDTNDFNGHTISNAVITKSTEKVFDFTALQSTNFTVDFNNGPYQLIKIGADVTITLTNFPNDTTPTKNGRVTLHLTSNDSHNAVSFTATNGNSIKYDENYPRIDDSTIGQSTIRHLGVTSSTNPTIVEIWKFKDTFFIKYIGFFS